MTLAIAGSLALLLSGGADPDTARVGATYNPPATGAMAAPTPAAGAALPSGDDYLLHPPVISLSMRGGGSFPMAGSDFFDFVTEELTLEPNDFDGGLVGVDLAVHLSEHADFIAGLSYTHGSADSRYRHVDEPVQQWTRLQQTPLTVGLRIFPLGRGRQVGEFVWIPDSVRPYVGGTAGIVFYRLVQDGEWVDAAADPDLPLRDRVFEERFESDGWGRAVQAVAGMEVGVTPRFALTLEGRYQGGSADLGEQFEGFEPLDLHGAQVTLGFSYAF